MAQKLSQNSIHEIKALRSHGYTLPEISKKFNISKSSVFRHVENIEILPEFFNFWRSKRGGSRNRKILSEKKFLEEGKKLVRKLSNTEKLLFLCALYWGEGSKKDFGLSNTDANLISIFVNGLREIFGITNDSLRVSIRIYEDLDKDKCLEYWSKIVGLPQKKFVSVNILPGKKKGKLEYGMCRVRVAKGGMLLKKVNGINKAIIEVF